MNFQNIRIGQRLALGFGVVIALLVLLAGLSYYRITGLSKEVSTMVQDRYPKTVVANQIKAQLNEMSCNMLNVLDHDGC